MMAWCVEGTPRCTANARDRRARLAGPPTRVTISRAAARQKFSWSPAGVLSAAHNAARYLEPSAEAGPWAAGVAGVEKNVPGEVGIGRRRIYVYTLLRVTRLWDRSSARLCASFVGSSVVCASLLFVGSLTRPPIKVGNAIIPRGGTYIDFLFSSICPCAASSG